MHPVSILELKIWAFAYSHQEFNRYSTKCTSSGSSLHRAQASQQHLRRRIRLTLPLHRRPSLQGRPKTLIHPAEEGHPRLAGDGRSDAHVGKQSSKNIDQASSRRQSAKANNPRAEEEIDRGHGRRPSSPPRQQLPSTRSTTVHLNGQQFKTQNAI